MRTGRWAALAIALLPMPVAAEDLPSLTKSAEAGDVKAERRLGHLYQTGQGVARNYALALKYYLLAAQAGDAVAANEIGFMYGTGQGVPRDHALAFKYYSQAAQAGYPPGLNNVARAYVSGTAVPHDYALAFKYYSQSAQAGNAEGITGLGVLYATGGGVPQDYAQARQYYLQAAQSGSLQAINNLGALYANGRGVPRDYAMAFKYYSQAAQGGLPQAQCNLAQLYKNGRGVAKDVPRAMDLFLAAGKKGWGAGYFNLGLIYRDGLDGIPADAKAANDAFRSAVTNGYEQAASFIVNPSSSPATPDRGFVFTAPGTQVAPVRLTGATVPKGPRLALVIANGEYAPNLNTLKNPVNDGKLMAAALTSAGFTVTQRYNLKVVEMKDALATFVDALRKAGPNTTALFYYAGHGAAAEGVNYLIPVGQEIKNETSLQTYGQSAEEILKLLDKAKPVTTIVILDACRNVPFSGERGSGGGLTQMDARNGSIIAYSTAPGKTAADGDGGDSPYAAALAEMIRKSNEPLEIVFRKVRARVVDQTENRQTPWEATSLVSDFTFVPK